MPRPVTGSVPPVEQPNPRRRLRLLSSITMLAIAVGGMWFWSVQKTEQIFQLAADEYIRCAVAAGPDAATAHSPLGDSLGRQLAAAGQMSLVSAGNCLVDNRDFSSIVLERGKSLVSVALTKRTDQDILPRVLAGRVVESEGIAIHQSQRNGLAVATFEAGGWLVFVVSTLGEDANAELARRIAPVTARSGAI